MTYEILLTDNAKAELDEAYDWLARRTDEHAASWYNGLLDALFSLEELPARCPLAPESIDSHEPIHQLLYGDKHHACRILFAIRGRKVLVHHVRHAARGKL